MSLSITHTSKTTVVLILDVLTVRSRLSSSITAGELYRCLRTWFSPLFTTPALFFMASLCAVLFLNKCLWVFLFWQLQLFLALSCFIPHTTVMATLMPISRSQVQSDNRFSLHCCCTPKCLLLELPTSEVLVIRFTFIQIAWKQHFPWGPSLAGMMLSAALRGNNVRDP